MTSSRDCFCGCDLKIVSANQLAGNLLGWDLTSEFGEWMQVLALLHAASQGRDYGEEPFIADGREITGLYRGAIFVAAMARRAISANGGRQTCFSRSGDDWRGVAGRRRATGPKSH